MTKAYTVEYINKQFENAGCKLLSTEYKNQNTKLRYICSCGKESIITYSNFSKGRRCRSCGNKKISDKTKAKFDENLVASLYEQGETISEICKKTGISKSVFYRFIRESGVEKRPTKASVYHQKLNNDILKCKICVFCKKLFTHKKDVSIYCSSACGILDKRQIVLEDFTEINDITAYWAGFIFGDGHVSGNNLKISLAKTFFNKQHLSKFSELVYGINNMVLTFDKHHYVGVNDPNLVKNLAKHYGIIELKTYYGTPIIPKGYESPFIRGLFDADGWISYKKWDKKYNKYRPTSVWGICSYSRETVEIVQSLLPQNITTRISKKKKQHLYELVCSDKNHIIKLREFLYPNHKKEDLCLSIKKRKMFKITSSTKNRSLCWLET